MIELNDCWRVWSELIDNESVIYGHNDKHSFYLTSRVQHFTEYENHSIAVTLDGTVKLNGHVKGLKASPAVFRNIQSGLHPEEAIKVGKVNTPLAAKNRARP